jgi:hypothetical protein
MWGRRPHHPGSVGCPVRHVTSLFPLFHRLLSLQKKILLLGRPFVRARLCFFCACSSVSIFRKPKRFEVLRALAGVFRYFARTICSASRSLRAGFRCDLLRKSRARSVCRSFRRIAEEWGGESRQCTPVSRFVWTLDAVVLEVELHNQPGRVWIWDGHPCDVRSCC